MNINELLPRLKKVSKSGNGYTALCPAHNDHNPSLSISESKDGKILLKCHTGCSCADVCEALGIKEKDLFPDNKTEYRQKPIKKEFDREHIYTDESGNIIAKKKIYRSSDGGKSAKWERYENGSYIAGLKGIEPPLYHLSRVVKELETVYITEGEKDAETVEKMGYTATTIPNKKWLFEYKTYLQNKDIIIIRDIDEVGKIQADKAAAELLEVAKSIKIINPATMCEGLPKNGDISDVVSKIGLKNAKQALIKAILDTSIITHNDVKVNPIWLTSYVTQQGKTKFEINEPVYAECFAKQHKILYADEAFYNGNGKVKDNLIMQIIYNDIKPYITSNVARITDNLYRALTREATTTIPLQPENLICYAGGSLTVNKDGVTNNHNDETFSINRLNVIYDETAQPPKEWDKLLSDMLEPADIITLQEYLGYCLTTSVKARKMLFLIGMARDGKSQIGEFMMNLLKGSAAPIKMHALSDRFVKALVSHQLLIYDDDLDTAKLSTTGELKQIVSGGEMQGEYKGKTHFIFKPYAKILACGNNPLSSKYDYSEGFYNRIIILNAKPHNRPEKEDNRDIQEILQKGKSGIFNWCLEGLVRLMRNNWVFTISEKSAEALQDLREDDNSLIPFLKDKSCIEFGDYDTHSVHTQALLRVYKEWCEENGIKPLADKTITTQLKDIAKYNKFPIQYTENCVIASKRSRGYKGMKLLRTYSNGYGGYDR